MEDGQECLLVAWRPDSDDDKVDIGVISDPGGVAVVRFDRVSRLFREALCGRSGGRLVCCRHSDDAVGVTEAAECRLEDSGPPSYAQTYEADVDRGHARSAGETKVIQ